MISLAYSPCPNDTFIFDALVHGRVASPEEGFEVTLADIEVLNTEARAGRFDVSKVSYGVLASVLDDYVLLSSGGALGRGVGPLVVAREPAPLEHAVRGRVAVPGTDTTAFLLLSRFAPPPGEIVVMRFDEILGAVAAGEVDAGLVIHESRFTYQRHGLVSVADLGDRWEAATGQPIPLGAIVARRSLGPARIAALDAAIAASARFALDHPDASADYVRAHAAELDDAVTAQHIALYVNEFSVDLGDEGRAAVRTLLAAAGAERDPFG